MKSLSEADLLLQQIQEAIARQAASAPVEQQPVEQQPDQGGGRAPASMDFESFVESVPKVADPNREKVEAKQNNTAQNSLTQALYMSPESYAAMTREMSKSPQFKAEQQTINNLGALLKEYVTKTPIQTDYTPLMQLTDTWTGSNLAKGYARPDNYNSMIGKIQSQLAAIGKSKNEYADNLTNALNAMKMGQIQNMTKQDAGILAGSQQPHAPRSGKTEQDRLNTKVEGLEKRYGSFIPNAVSAFRQIDTFLGGIDKGLRTKKNIPGYGKPWEKPGWNTDIKTAWNRFTNSGWSPDIVASEKGKEFRQLIMDLEDLIKRQRSGAAITAQEAITLQTILGDTRIAGNDRDIYLGLQKFRENFADILAAHEAAYDSPVVSTYAERLFGPGTRSFSGVVRNIGVERGTADYELRGNDSKGQPKAQQALSGPQIPGPVAAPQYKGTIPFSKLSGPEEAARAEADGYKVDRTK